MIFIANVLIYNEAKSLPCHYATPHPWGSDCFFCLPRVSALTRLHAEATLCHPLTRAQISARHRLAAVFVTTKNALAGVEKNSRCSLRRMRCAYCEDCAGAQNEELALLVE